MNYLSHTSRLRAIFQFPATAAVLILASGLLVAGCNTSNTGFKLAGDSASIAREIASNVELTQAGMRDAVASLERLAELPMEDPRAHLNSFQSNLDKADSSWKAIDELVLELRRTSNAYFDAWENDLANLGNEQIRSTSRERRTDLMETVTDLQSQYEDTRRSISPFLERMRNVNQMLRNDFTSEGIRSAGDAIADLRQDIQRRQNALEELRSEAAAVVEALAIAGG